MRDPSFLKAEEAHFLETCQTGFFRKTCQTGLEETLEESSDVAAQLGADLRCLLGARARDPQGLEWVPGEKVCLEKDQAVKVRQHRKGPNTNESSGGIHWGRSFLADRAVLLNFGYKLPIGIRHNLIQVSVSHRFIKKQWWKGGI